MQTNASQIIQVPGFILHSHVKYCEQQTCVSIFLSCWKLGLMEKSAMISNGLVLLGVVTNSEFDVLQ